MNRQAITLQKSQSLIAMQNAIAMGNWLMANLLAAESAEAELKLSELYIRDSRPEDAAISLISRAGCLIVSAQALVQQDLGSNALGALKVATGALQDALANTKTPTTKQWIEAEIGRVGAMAADLITPPDWFLLDNNWGMPASPWPNQKIFKDDAFSSAIREWMGNNRVTFAIVLTDVVGSTSLQHALGDTAIQEYRRAHFDQSRRLMLRLHGREDKAIGDSYVAAFKSVDAALVYALSLQQSTGQSNFQVRTRLHIGTKLVEKGDICGGKVSLSTRFLGEIEGDGIQSDDSSKSWLLEWQGLLQNAVTLVHHGTGTRRVKGLDPQVMLWAVRSEEE